MIIDGIKCRSRCPASLEVYQRHRHTAASTPDQHHLSGGVGLGAQPTKKLPIPSEGRFAQRAMASRPHCVHLRKQTFLHLGESLGERCGRGWRKTSHLRLPEEQTAGGCLLAGGV
ncbi:hypothetical protein CTAM01_17240 [Colletotrichum tamarilloi]|uniref:Uncharacterized protein n=1 Tax=Colletotrichum tamarilloi TaxID=1209934 RepID=A0ABQ9QGC8_9PEZI|nr:uncharacterized protein CTAM01_17240 [Colletotrichum tamarilloi]KAK1454225.1 hypothetical protein CTAM01_17240 [Colletotrichum tamarilloi]